MISCNILITKNKQAVLPNEINEQITEFGESYINATHRIISDSQSLDQNGETFIKCASLILSKFGMTRRGVFSKNIEETLQVCWDRIGKRVIDIKNQINDSGNSRDRYLLEISETELDRLTAQLWSMTKDLLPITMSNHSYGLVGASKILFSVLPELVLPVDNQQWMQLFKTVDLGDVIQFMAQDIRKWESATGENLNRMDPSGRLSTLPAVYNVVAMAARKTYSEQKQ
jgi:hypothetical protein